MTFFFDADIARMEEAQKTSEPPANWKRAGGDCLCPKCGKKYYAHPQNDPWYFLHELCTGEFVKL